jgi:hypothetical protein
VFSAVAAAHEVVFDLVEPGQHLRIDVDHGASQAGFSAAPCSAPDPGARVRLTEVIANLADRIAETRINGWLGEVENLQYSLNAACGKLAVLDGTARNNVGPHRARHADHPSPAGDAMTATTLTTALTRCAAGLYPLEAGTALLIAEGTFLRDDFTSRFIEHATSNGTPMAAIDWDAAIIGISNSELPCSAGERRILAAAASIAADIPVDLRDTVAGLDARNIQLLITAISHAAEHRPDDSGNP